MDAGRRGEARYPLELDSLVYNSKYLPEGHPLSDERKSAITFKHLLTHTAGLPSGSDKYDSPCFDFIDFTVGRCTAYPQSNHLLFDPGCGYEYSNIGYNHLSVISPHITGKPLYKDIEEGIWSRIGVESADWPERTGAFIRNGLVYQPAGSGPGMTTLDLARFAYLLLHKGQWEGHCIVPEWYLRTALQIDPINNSQPEYYGLGFYSNTTYQLAA
ncbi:serine hydrolase [Paenibacillus sp. RC67]|uniref:serine hydrolase domain-containing protein n=1 Tax=Paenibacillus sp. RC67 TaxID=3039392 RepID=UPI0024AD3BB7|nr:serine hydrolase [Paenibacillus sp. RC67]